MSEAVEFLSEAWLARRRELLGPLDVGPGVPDHLRVLNTVVKAPGGDVSWLDRYEGGHLVASTLGSDEADLSLATPYPEAVRLLRGELGENAAFIQGLTKTTGVTGPLLGLLSHQGTDRYGEARAALAEATSLPS